MNATLLKRFFRVARSGASAEVEAICRRVIEDEKKKGHEQVASDLERILAERPTPRPPSAHPSELQPLPTSGRDAAPLVQETPFENLRHLMVLPPRTEQRFTRIEKEFAARTRLATFGLRPRNRILLYGPPGCGKSLGAERLAWNTGLPLRKVRFDTLLSSYFGETLSNLRTVFDTLKTSPCALLLDECDTLARSRMARNDVGEATRITNALLDLLESFPLESLVIATSNLDSVLDSALFRRFDEVLRVPPPGIDEIRRLFTYTLSPMKVEKHLPLEGIVLSMDGMSCSDVVSVTQNAAKHTVMDGRDTVMEDDVRHAIRELLEQHNLDMK